MHMFITNEDEWKTNSRLNRLMLVVLFFYSRTFCFATRVSYVDVRRVHVQKRSEVHPKLKGNVLTMCWPSLREMKAIIMRYATRSQLQYSLLLLLVFFFVC